MPWVRGKGTVQVELANVQSWIETNDPVLNGKNGDPGMIRLFHDDRAKQEQRDKDIGILIKVVAWVFGPMSLIEIVLSVLRALHVIK